MTKRIAILAYGVVAYTLFLGVFLYAVGFIGDFAVPRTLDSPVRTDAATAILTNFALLGLFAVQHSAMARPAFKRRLLRIVPESAERSTYVLASNLALVALFAWWQPIEGRVWSIQSPVGRTVAHALFATGWLTVLGTTFLINHFDLFGLRQVWTQFRGREYRPLGFVVPGPYRFVRHPLYVGWLTAFWATPDMSWAHLVFALGTTGYIFAAIVFEERDLIEAHGEKYVEYRKRVPMILPLPSRAS